MFDINTTTVEVLDGTSFDSNLTTQGNHNGWVNPEDLTPMPQCIAQQNPSTWLSTMTGCTGKRCTRHFGVICTHYQWLTQASCLSTGFSPDVVKNYLPYCSRSVLAKAQLYQWISGITGRTWLIDVGDANELRNLSPDSLSEGYAALSVTSKAPACLTGSASALSMEPFQQVLASCGFTSTTQHTGRADRPWEYRGDLHSMVALDFETVGYDLIHGSIGYGDYFDKECFCRAFTVDPEKEPCLGPEYLEWTQEQLWMNVTCGPTSLPSNWTDSLKITGFSYIPIEDWHWPNCVRDMPKQVTGLVHQCATEACGLDPSGYCKVKPTVDRACICRNISFESCGGSCQIFETRIDYLNWLHDLCGDVEGWHGLPDNWRELDAPTTLELIPWHWAIKPSNGWDKCASNMWKLGSFVLVNVATFLSAIYGRAAGIHRFAPCFPRLPSSWFFAGMLIAALQLLANWINVAVVQETLGYADSPVTELVFLWCSMPRFVWLTFLLVILQPFDAIDSAAKSSLCAEIILQALSANYMVRTVTYGLKHNFYFGRLEGVEGGQSAKLMYTGALLWLIITTVALVSLIRVVPRSGSDFKPSRQGSKQTTSGIVETLMAKLDEPCIWLGEMLESYWMHTSNVKAFGETSSLVSGGRNRTMYGTLPVKHQGNLHFRKELAKLYAVTAVSMLFLWFAQWLFWGGFIGLSSEAYVFKHRLWPVTKQPAQWGQKG